MSKSDQTDQANQTGRASSGPLAGLRVIDLSRILAGPAATQILGDLDCDIIKIERPGAGDDTRKWGPNYLKDRDGNPVDESAYYASANRNKRSVAIDITQPEGAALVKALLADADVLIENFKVGGLSKYGLGYEQLKDEFPGLVYCSITGFGQTGPYADRPGYDFMIQGMGGIMSLTGEPEGEPMKVGVAVADVMCGMYASVSILAALRHRDATGRGQMIDLSLLDTQIAWLMNQGLNYLTTGIAPARFGNAHPNIVPYQVFPTSDGHFVLAVGNDAQFQRFCEIAEIDEVGADPRFVTNDARIANRDGLIPLIKAATARRTTHDWLERLAGAGVPAGPVNTLDRVFADPQVRHRGMEIAMTNEATGGATSRLIASPIRMSETPVSYRIAPPALGQHTAEVLGELLGLDAAALAALAEKGVIGGV